jgi:hypothetical protein
MLSGRHERMPTGALAEIRLQIAAWPELGLEARAEAVRVFRPKELD